MLCSEWQSMANCVPHKSPQLYKNSKGPNQASLPQILTLGSVWASGMPDAHLHPFCQLQGSDRQFRAQSSLERQSPDPWPTAENPSNWEQEVCAKHEAGLYLDPWGPGFPRSCVCLMPSVQ